MSKVRLVVQCRLGSQRLPGKALLHIGGMPLVVLCARRAANTGLDTVVATGAGRGNDLIASVVEKAGFRVVRGDEDDVLGRFLLAIEDLSDDDIVVRVTADNVIPDGALIGEMVNLFERSSADYVAPAYPDDGLPHGVMAEVVRASTLRRSAAQSNAPEDREHVTLWIRKNGKSLRFQPSKLAEEWRGLEASIDQLNDFERMAGILETIEAPLQTPWWNLCDRLAQACGQPGGEAVS